MAPRPDFLRGRDDRLPRGAAADHLRGQRAAQHSAQHLAAAAAELSLDADSAHGHGEGRVSRPPVLRGPRFLRPSASGSERFHQPAGPDDRHSVRPPSDAPHPGHDDRAALRCQLDPGRGRDHLADPRLHRRHSIRLAWLQHRAVGLAPAAPHELHGQPRHHRLIRQRGKALWARPLLHRALSPDRQRVLRHPALAGRAPLHDGFRPGQHQHARDLDHLSVHRSASDRRPALAWCPDRVHAGGGAGAELDPERAQRLLRHVRAQPLPEQPGGADGEGAFDAGRGAAGASPSAATRRDPVRERDLRLSRI